jgi:hypothetical protein
MDGILLNSGEFPLLLGSYATIPKAPCGKSIDPPPVKVDLVHANVGQNVTPHNPSLGLFLYHFLHTMSL